jgi:hypothetical protein
MGQPPPSPPVIQSLYFLSIAHKSGRYRSAQEGDISLPFPAILKLRAFHGFFAKQVSEFIEKVSYPETFRGTCNKGLEHTIFIQGQKYISKEKNPTQCGI